MASLNSAFQRGAFQRIAYQQLTPNNQPSGGWLPDYESVQYAKRVRRRRLEEAQLEARQIQDELDRAIAIELRTQEAKDAQRDELSRLQVLADKWAGKVSDLPKPVSVAILNAQDARTLNSLQQMERVIEQMLDEDMMIAMQQVLLMLDS